jgi:hypothetical protein
MKLSNNDAKSSKNVAMLGLNRRNLSLFILLALLLLQSCGDTIIYALGAHEPSHNASDRIGKRLSSDKNALNYSRRHRFTPFDFRLESNLDFGKMNVTISCDKVFNTLDIMIGFPNEESAKKFLVSTNGRTIFVNSIISAAKDDHFSGKCKIYCRWSGFRGQIPNSKSDDQIGELILFYYYIEKAS